MTMNRANRYWLQLKEAESAIQRVREIHTPKEWENTCKTCDKTDMGERVEYPCPTIQALDGEQ